MREAGCGRDNNINFSGAGTLVSDLRPQVPLSELGCYIHLFKVKTRKRRWMDHLSTKCISPCTHYVAGILPSHDNQVRLLLPVIVPFLSLLFSLCQEPKVNR